MHNAQYLHDVETIKAANKHQNKI